MNYRHLMYSILASLLALGLMYLDTKLLDNPKTKVTYIKGMTMVGMITWILLYFIDGGFGNGGGAAGQGGIRYLPGLNEEIITGPPDF